MQQLTGLDAAFLALESPGVYGHVGSVCLLDSSTGAQPLTLERLSAVIEQRLHLVPPFRRRLATVPLGLDQPYWIEDPDFDIEYHVRELALPAPGDDRQLAEQAARLHARPLDRSRPLWELYLISGLSGGRLAIYSKVHHAAIDGVSGNDILGALLDTTPEGREIEPPPPWEPENLPGPAMLLARSAIALTGHPMRALRLSTDLVRRLPALVSSPARPRLPLIDRLLRRGQEDVLSQTGLRAPRTPFNKPITPHRRWAFRTIPFADVKRVKQASGMTVNDVVMALCAGALRQWLQDHDALPESPLIAAVPVSVRSAAESGAGGNRVSTMLAPLPTHVADPAKRLGAVHEAMRAAKEQHGAMPADLLSDVTQFAMPALAGQAARLTARLRLLEWLNPFNLFISNVPGPAVPLYYAGAKLIAYYPLSAISHGQGLNITVMSYGDGMHFGLIACRELVPDLEDIADYLVTELQVLLDLVEASA
ncbi:MAG TPA: wax ester/triacylglycerol synthase family O-acyltransferase [Mycobacteriales bacterium]|nr:wax ester/triacylglycerol synthase family O-acyltransferase [Mycobacteriales bacterium]